MSRVLESEEVWRLVRDIEVAAWARRWGDLRAARLALEKATGMSRPYSVRLNAGKVCGVGPDEAVPDDVEYLVYHRPVCCGVYFVRSQSLIKIGISENITKRLRELRSASKPYVPFVLQPLGYISFESLDDARGEENALHCRFSNWRVRGEWFYACPEILRFIDETASTWPSENR